MGAGASLTGWAKRTSGGPPPTGLVKKSLKPKYFPDFFQLTLKRRNLYEFSRKFIDIRKIIFILAETTWDIVPKHY